MIGISVFNTAQKNVRDQKRLRDLTTIKQALELYRSDMQMYPLSADLGIGTSEPFTNPSGAKVYLNPVPSDSNPGSSYVYEPLPTSCNNLTVFCDNFIVCAKKEGVNTLNLPSDCVSVSCGSGNCDMGVSSD